MPRLRGYVISGEFIGRAIQRGEHVFNNGPQGVRDDAVFHHAYYDSERRSFVAVFEHPSYENISEGAKILLAPFSADSKTIAAYVEDE